MAEYEISPGAERDLLEIAIYTITVWGPAQAERYQAALQRRFSELGQRGMQARAFLEHRPELLVTRCEHHFIFFLMREVDVPLVLAVLHENMDLVARVRERLDRDGLEG